MTGPMTSRLKTGAASEVMLNAARAEVVYKRRILVTLLVLLMLRCV